MNATYWFLGGVLGIVAGVALISVPYALIVGGTFCLFIGLFLALGKAYLERAGSR